MRSTKILLIAAVIVGTMSIVQARHLNMAPLKGMADTFGKRGDITFQGQVAQGLFEKMPENTIVAPNSTCFPTAITKRKAGIECMHGAKEFYECTITINLATGLLIDRDEATGGACGQDQSDIDRAQKEAKKRGYWSDTPDGE
jgi:hypothetical protein